MKRRFIVRCTPTPGMVSATWVKGIEDIGWPMNTIKAAMFMHDEHGGEIAECRNHLVAKVLEVESTHGDWSDDSAILWIDDDVIVTQGILHQLNQYDCDIATGVYFVKGEHGEPIIFPELGNGTLRYSPAGDGEQKAYKGAWMGSMGLSLVRTSVYRRLRDELQIPLDKYGHHEWYRTTIGRPNELVNENGVLHKGGTEDSWFATLAAKLGYTMTVDLTKYAFGFHFDAKAKVGYPLRQWKERQAVQPVTWPQPDGTVIKWT